MKGSTEVGGTAAEAVGVAAAIPAVRKSRRERRGPSRSRTSRVTPKPKRSNPEGLSKKSRSKELPKLKNLRRNP